MPQNHIEPIETITDSTDPPEVIEALRSLTAPAVREQEPIYIWD